jgi:hypothetical protein
LLLYLDPSLCRSFYSDVGNEPQPSGRDAYPHDECRPVSAMPTFSQSSPDVVMVLENNAYPQDARVRQEAESLVESGLSVEVFAPRQPDRPARELIRGVRVTRFPLPDGRGTLIGTAVEYLVACCVVTAAVLPRLVRGRRGTLHVHNPPDFFFPLLWLARRRGWSSVFDHHDDAAER